MIRNLLFIFSFLFISTMVVGQTAVAGKVVDSETKEELIGANVIFFKNGVQLTGTSTDFNGDYKVNIDPGTYDVKTSYIGYADQQINGVVAKAGQTTNLPITLSEGSLLDLGVEVVAYTVPLIDKDNTTSGGTITSKEIRNLPTKNISALASTTAGLSQVDEGDDVTVRGSRADAVDYYIDGLRVSGSLIPESEIEQLQVITGGIGAQYGDVTGGIISITTKGPSAKFGGSVELETSEYLDDFGYNLVNANVSGPILRKKNEDGSKGESILGFRVAGRYRYQKDDDPPATNIYQVKDDVLAELQAEPILPGPIPAGQFLTNEDVNILGYRPNEEREEIDVTAKLDARFSDNIDVTFTGTFNDTKNKFTPTTSNRATWRLMNSHNNPTDHTSRYRGNFRFRHRLGKQGGSEEENVKGAVIQNAFYTLQAGYERDFQDLADSRHGDNYFNYGYVGKFFYDFTPTIGDTDWTGGVINPFSNPNMPEYFGHNDNRQVFTGYQGDTIVNPVLAAYNNNVDPGATDANPFAVNGIIAQNGFFLGETRNIWQNHHSNVGQVYNLNRQRDNELITFTANSSFDLVAGKSGNSRHSIEVGFLYEQRYRRQYDVSPRELWILARQLQNEHIIGVDTTTNIGIVDPNSAIYTTNPNLITGDVVLHDLALESNPQSNFYRKLREATGTPINQYINVDEVDPSLLRLDMFNAFDLINGEYVDYYGYDYLGNKLANNVTFNDFFTATDSEGKRTFPVAAFQPNYFAGYIQDKFTLNEMTFRLGLRIDRYDANTKVLKDPYSLYEIKGAGDFYNEFGGEKPGAIEDDFKIYTETGDEFGPVQAFRDGDQWYDGNGTAINNAINIFGFNGVANPVLVDPDADIQDENFNPSVSFEDYEPQVNFMPRLAFSFPISDDANFFAHYDVLVQRPPSNTVATALDYFFFEDKGPPVNNPALRPEKTVDYEVGFRQKVSATSAIKIAIYYKELRDMIQRRIYTYVDKVNSYDSFGNLDFGTVKGFTFQYDMRRTGNISANINYTLQFADGTGSDPQSNQNLLSRGNIRNLIPLNFDERHRITASVDYRYGSNEGPILFGKRILGDFGINLQAITVSGRPYSARTTPRPFSSLQLKGALNGSRKPWTVTMNMRVDKRITLSKSSKFPLNLNLYFRVSNLLNTRNVLDLYSASSSAETDGFLISQDGQDAIRTIDDNGLFVPGYLASYQWAETNPDFFSLPRRIYIGGIFEF